MNTLNNKKRLRHVIAGVAFVAVVSTQSLAAQLLPFDHASQDQSLLEFRTQLLAAVDQRDFDQLEPFLSPDIQLSFGGHYGVAEAQNLFRDEPRLWDELAKALRNGGGFETNRETGTKAFVAPYTYFVEAPADLDVFEFVILTDENVAVHAEAATGSPVIGRYSYEILLVDSSGNSDENWQAIKLPDGQSGYVEQTHIATATDYRAGFEKAGGLWKMIYLLAGD